MEDQNVLVACAGIFALTGINAILSTWLVAWPTRKMLGLLVKNTGEAVDSDAQYEGSLSQCFSGFTRFRSAIIQQFHSHESAYVCGAVRHDRDWNNETQFRRSISACPCIWRLVKENTLSSQLCSYSDPKESTVISILVISSKNANSVDKLYCFGGRHFFCPEPLRGNAFHSFIL